MKSVEETVQEQDTDRGAGKDVDVPVSKRGRSAPNLEANPILGRAAEHWCHAGKDKAR